MLRTHECDWVSAVDLLIMRILVADTHFTSRALHDFILQVILDQGNLDSLHKV